MINMQQSLWSISVEENEVKLKAICENEQKMSREQLLTYRDKDKSNRVTLVLPFHHKFRGIQQVLQKSFNKVITCNPDLKQIFPDPPMISFRRTPNIWDKVVQANHSWHKSYQPVLPPEGKSYIAHHIKTTPKQLLTPSVTECVNEHIGNVSAIGTIYSALCTKHKKLYVGQTRQSLNDRFNGHSSDAVYHPDRSGLAQHYNENDCDIRHELEISVVEHARGSGDCMKHKEDKCIMTLQTYSPLGLNPRLSDFGCIYQLLFSKGFLQLTFDNFFVLVRGLTPRYLSLW